MIKITDEMVDRAYKALGWVENISSRKIVRASLEAALNPPEPEPSIVTSEMLKAGCREYDEWHMDGRARHNDASPVLAIFHAMYRARPKDAESSDGQRAEYAGFINDRTSPSDGKIHKCKRWDDPK